MKKNILFYLFGLTIIIGCKTNTIQEKEKVEEIHPKNVILLIGDGMGLSQLSSVFYYKEGIVNIARFKNIGLIKTSSASHDITDSGAGATAFSCGKKTYNQAIGIGVDSLSVMQNLTEALSNYRHGLISTSSITHATPASFFAHVPHRSQEEQIASQLHKSNIDFFAGGGLKFFNKRKDKNNYLDSLNTNGFIVDTTGIPTSQLDINKKYGYLLAEKDMLKMEEGRGDFLSRATGKALGYLSQNQEGFFLMVEGSQIDWGAHNNDADYLISEMIDFDNAIGTALDFAKKDGNTLVIVTADHETGGFSMAEEHKVKENGDKTKIAPVFSNTGHSATMVPVLAFGKGAEGFGGIYENNELHQRIMDFVKE